jgi:hypothetical protein
VTLLAVALAAITNRSAFASTLSSSASVDAYTGPASHWTRAALGLGDIAFDRIDILGGAMRFDDAIVGPGYGVVLGGGVSLTGPVTVRVLVTRYLGDQGYRAWRIKTGPQWELPRGSLGISFVHDANNDGPESESASGELSLRVTSDLAARANGSYGRTSELEGFALALGTSWTVVPHLELAGDMGIARNPPAATPGPSGGGPLNGLPGPGRRAHEMTPTSDQVGATTELVVRVSFP